MSLYEAPTVQQFSVNQFKTWHKCKKKYYYDNVLNLRWPSDPSNFGLGLAVHKLLEFQSRGLNCDPLIASAEPAVQAAWKMLCAHPITHQPIIASEWAFHVPLFLPEPAEIFEQAKSLSTQATPLSKQTKSVAKQAKPAVWLTGRIDRIAKNTLMQNPTDGSIWVIDWKTGTAVPRFPETDWQTRLYLYAVVEAAQELGLTGYTAEKFSFIYVEVKQAIRLVTVHYSSQKHEETHALLQQTVQAILHEETCQEPYPLPESCPDRYCPYRAICGIQDKVSAS